MIFVEKDTPLTRAEVKQKIDILNQAVKETQAEIASPKIKAALHRVVPTFRSPEKVNKKAAEADEMKEVNAQPAEQTVGV